MYFWYGDSETQVGSLSLSLSFFLSYLCFERCHTLYSKYTVNSVAESTRSLNLILLVLGMINPYIFKIKLERLRNVI
jgi:hypothetical protein